MPQEKRPVIPMSEKRAAMERAGNLCEKCRGDLDINLHHVIAYAAGGPDTADNLCVLCTTCHHEWHALSSFYVIPFDEWLTLPPLGQLIHLLRTPEVWPDDITARDFRDAFMAIHSATKLIGRD